ncbi:hypothetical protein [Rhodococcus pyridinivorans]|uniref:hypothetical protein n=1 Tax=Rhodococcus pyridinivorans TaxID=103816 RepID=UPI000A64E3B8|nr:hypothetical protein [Rhodococcus pyridinivorans]KLL95488.1 hypothetical protein NJ76_25945 [Rhodococcus sp. IITR03]QQM52602.1 hypothetical protein JGU70_19225 [Rhodococcus pyridinivorans]
MSQQYGHAHAARPISPPQRPVRRAPINRDELNELPTVRGRDAAVAFVRERLGVPVTPNRMRTALERRELPVYKIDRWNFTAERDLYDWLLSLAKTRKDGAA